MDNSKRAVVVFSGGQDSTTCLGWARNRFQHVEAITFRYGQKHSIEVEQAREICKLWKILQIEVDLSFLAALVDSALTSDGDVNQPHGRLPHLPASYVPNRNALFLTLAHAYAQKVCAGTIVTGVCQTDNAGYPDCRNAFIRQLTKTLNIGADANIMIATPLLYRSKAEIFLVAKEEGVLQEVLRYSHTCYCGVRDPHAWGAGCGACPACKLRAAGWAVYQRGTGH